MYDPKNLAKLQNLNHLAPEAFKAFVAFDEAVVQLGVVPLKYKELIAVAVALTTQCPYCIDIHSKKARKAGATDQEIAETTLLAAALRAGGAITHGTHALDWRPARLPGGTGKPSEACPCSPVSP
jgi:AhpD family alkylhydroperoxidase